MNDCFNEFWFERMALVFITTPVSTFLIKHIYDYYIVKKTQLKLLVYIKTIIIIIIFDYV